MPDAADTTPSPDPPPAAALPQEVIALLRCPVTRSPLRLQGEMLIAESPRDAPLSYPIRDGLPLLLPGEANLPESVADLDEYRAKYHHLKSEISDLKSQI